MKPTPFLGVVTGPVPPSLAAQLGLGEGFGIVVEDVAPGSPAATAGVQRFDVLKLLDDQQLTDPNHLAALVRGRGKDADVSLTLIRRGQEQKVTVKIGERMMPERRPLGFDMENLRRQIEPWRQPAEDAARRLHENVQPQMREFQERMQQFQRRMRDWQERLREWQKNPTGNPPDAPKFENIRAENPPHGPRDLLREARPGGASEVQVSHDGNTTRWNTSQARVSIIDESGQIEVSSDHGRRTLKATGPQGDVIFDGPIDTEEQRRALPEDIRRKLARIDLRANSLHGEAAASAHSAPERTAPPVEREIQ